MVIYIRMLLWDAQWGDTVDHILEEFCMEARGVEKFIGSWTQTRAKNGGLGLASTEW